MDYSKQLLGDIENAEFCLEDEIQRFLIYR